MIQRNCKNCGSPLEHSYNHKCPYCGTLYDFNVPEDKITKVTPEDLINIELRDVNYSPITDSIVLMFSGLKVEMPKVYEYDGKHEYISKIEEYINPPKCGFCLEFPIHDIEKFGMSYLMYRVSTCGIRFDEIDNVKHQLLTNEKIERLLLIY